MMKRTVAVSPAATLTRSKSTRRFLFELSKPYTQKKCWSGHYEVFVIIRQVTVRLKPQME